MSHHPPLHPDESEPIALNPLLRGVDLAIDRLIRRNCFTGRTLDILDELREELLAVSSDTRPQGNPEMTLDDLRKIAEAATKGPWEATTSEVTMNDRSLWRIGDPHRPHVAQSVMRQADAEFFATFDPQRVLELLDENERLHGLITNYAREYPRECNKRVEAEARLAAVEKLHYAIDDGACAHCDDLFKYPCPTIQAVRGE